MVGYVIRCQNKKGVYVLNMIEKRRYKLALRSVKDSLFIHFSDFEEFLKQTESFFKKRKFNI
jgi:hypothetical protein